MPKKKPAEIEGPPSTLVKVPARLDEARDPAAGIQAKDLAPFTRLDGSFLPAQEAWGALPYSEIGPMFLDQFLLRYFIDLMRVPASPVMDDLGPWEAFVAANRWAKGMPSLFWQLTGYELSTRQLNAAIEQYVERQGKLDRVARHDPQALTPEVVSHHGE